MVNYIKEQVIFVVSPGQNGIEFNKTSGYFSNFPGMQVYLSLHGSGILLMQRNDELGEAKEFKMVILSPFKQVTVPAGWAMCLVNTGSNFLAVLRNSVLEDLIFMWWRKKARLFLSQILTIAFIRKFRLNNFWLLWQHIRPQLANHFIRVLVRSWRLCNSRFLGYTQQP